MPTELAEAFSPCTIDGLCIEWDRLNREIKALERSRDHIRDILLERSVAGADMGVEPAFRVGGTLGDQVKVQARWRLNDDGTRWHPTLRYVKEAK